MKYVFVVMLALFLSACGSRLDATYSNNMTGVAEQKMSFTFKPDGTARMTIGSTKVPLEMPYEVSGNKIKVTGQEGDITFTILENGDLLTEGMRLTKESASQATSPTPTVEAKAPDGKKPQEKDMAFCRELAAKARVAKPGAFAGDPEFLPSVNHCFQLAKETGEVLVWSAAD